jgi:SpoVK/Ycf46/Vps4 family AAA+-type ATPase
MRTITASDNGEGNSARKPRSLRDALQSSSSTTTEGSYRAERRGPPPVPAGGGGPGATQYSQQQNHHSISNASRDPAESDLDMTLMRCRSLLKERHDGNIVEMVLRDIVQQGMGVSFDDIAALETAKRLLNEAIVLPLMMPELFTGIRKPWKGVLLFGPPGTGDQLMPHT